MKKFLRIFLLFSLVVSFSISLSACSFIVKPDSNSGNGSTIGGGYNYSEVELQNVSISNINDSDRQPLSLADAVAKVERSVVAIKMSSGSGAGVIIDIDVEGDFDKDYVYIITCHHVIASQGEILVYIPDQTSNYYSDDYTFKGNIGGTFEANKDSAVTLVGGDMTSDIALIKIDITKPAVSGKLLDKSEIVKAKVPKEGNNVRKGEEVFAIGNPTGEFPGWVCNGIVSMMETNVNVSEVGNMLLMGISATTNPGNSGGGLFNLYGELVGITNAGNTSYEAINFAIPLYTSNKGSEEVIDNGFINIIQNLAGTATNVNYGYVAGRKALFGFTISKGNNNDTECVCVIGVNSGSVAEQAGLKVDDIIVSYWKNDGEEQIVTSYSEYTSMMSALKIGDTIKLKVSRVKYNSYGGGIVRPVIEEYELNKMAVLQYHFANTGIVANS